uniref:Uncharacterized protein n=1 Tax=Ananas comosus var. bracteatus TaxID=296719 RepID=A0A6V7NKC4_ANACO|nr:unnamed protein product [Ananas comosus var. bracteatus]
MAPPPPPPPSPPLMVKLRTVETCGVSPPEGSVPPTAVPLTFFDVFFLHARPMERLFFYPFPHPTSHFLSSFLPSLKSSLSLSLRSFFPLASLLRPSPAPPPLPTASSSSTPTPPPPASSSPSRSASATAAAVDFSTASQGPAARRRPAPALVPRLAPPDSAGSQPLLAVQVTVFPHHGVVVGTTMHHAACDGSSYTLFRQTWAAAARWSSGDISLYAHPSARRRPVPRPRSSRTVLAFLQNSRRQVPHPGARILPCRRSSRVIHYQKQPHQSPKSGFPVLDSGGNLRLYVDQLRPGERTGEKKRQGISCNSCGLPQPDAAPAPCGVLRKLHRAVLRRGGGRRPIWSERAHGGRGSHRQSHKECGERRIRRRREKWLETIRGLPAEAILTGAGSHRFGVYDTDFGGGGRRTWTSPPSRGRAWSRWRRAARRREGWRLGWHFPEIRWICSRFTLRKALAVWMVECKFS